MGDRHRFRIGQQRLEGLAYLPGQRHVPAAGLLVDQKRFYGGLLESDELKPLRGLHVGEVDVVGFTEFGDPGQRGVQFGDQVVLGSDGGVDAGCGAVGGVDGEGSLQVPEHAHVVDDETVVLVGEHPVGPGDGLHQQVGAHGLVEIHRRRGRRVESGEPHGAHEHQPERVVGVLELGVEILLDHPLAVFGNVESGLGHVGDLVLGLRHNHGHVGAAHELDQRLQMRTLQLGCGRQPIFEFGQVAGPFGLYQVVHADCGGLVDSHVHGLAPESPVDEVVHQIGSDLGESLGAGDQLVLLGEAERHCLLLSIVKCSFLQEVFQFVVEVLVGELQFGDAVLVVERDGGTVRDGVPEVVDRHVVAEHLPGLLLTSDERRAGEPQERRIRQRQAHVGGQRVVLGAVGLVGDDDDVVALRQHRHPPALLGRDELVDQREHISVVLAQQLAQMGRCLGVNLLSGGDPPGVGEVAIELFVEFLAVGDQHEGPAAGLLAQYLLGEPQHRQRLARPLRVPEHAEPALALLQLPQRLQRVVHPKELGSWRAPSSDRRVARCKRRSSRRGRAVDAARRCLAGPSPATPHPVRPRS